jgi:hypothetical protein
MPEVISLTAGTSLIDVGCGVGTWLRASQECRVSRLVGLDGDYVIPSQLLIDAELFRTCNLETDNLRDVAGGSFFDMTLCLEVAEHLTVDRAASFVSELCQLSDLVVFSAAVPGQGGTNHINEQWPIYWSNIFALQEFACFDILRRRLWERDDCEWWYLQNLLIFARTDSDEFRKLRFLGDPTPAPMAVIHPRNLQQKASEFHAAMEELKQLLIDQPFGRDEAIRMLEGKVDTLRELARGKADALDTAQRELAEARAAHERSLSLRQ